MPSAILRSRAFARTAACLAALASVVQATQNPSTTSGQGPSTSSDQVARGSQLIRSGVSLVALDFLALGRDGAPIPDLKPEEVSVKIGGRARPVQALNFISALPDPSQRVVSPLPPPFGSNIPTQDSRAFVLVVDDDSFRVGTERALREAADTFLDELAPTDRIALVTMPYGGTRVNMTTEQEMVRASLAQIIGQAPSRETPDDFATRSRRTLESLTGLFAGLAGSPWPVTVAFFSAGMAGPNQQEIRTGQPIAGYALRPEMWQQVGTAAAASGARLYIIEPVGLSNQTEGLEHLAGVTGAVRYTLGGQGENAFTRILRETSGFYRLTFEPEASQRNGNMHRVELRASRPDVTVRVRPSIRIDRSDARAGEPKELLRQTTVYRDLPLRVTGFTSRETGQTKLKVVALGEPIDSATALTAAAVGLIDMKGSLVAQSLFGAGQLKPGQPITAAMLVPPGIYRLRLAAADSGGRVGTSDYDLEAELRQAGPLQLSGLVLGLSRGGFVPKLQFGIEPVALAYLEIYGGQAGQKVSATIDIARTFNGPAILTMPGALAATGDHHSVTAALPIAALSPGDYIVRASVGVVGQPFTRVERTLRKVVE
jgi:hypothetical protein